MLSLQAHHDPCPFEFTFHLFHPFGIFKHHRAIPTVQLRPRFSSDGTKIRRLQPNRRQGFL